MYVIWVCNDYFKFKKLHTHNNKMQHSYLTFRILFNGLSCLFFQWMQQLSLFSKDCRCKQRQIHNTTLKDERKTLQNDKQATLNQTSWPHPFHRCTEINNCSVACEHVKHLITNQHVECRPAHVLAVSLPLAVLALWSGSHLFSLAPFITTIREVSWLSAAGPPLSPPPAVDRD